MKNNPISPITYQNHPHQKKLRRLLFELFLSPQPEKIVSTTSAFLGEYSLPLDDFPRLEGTYSRTIVHRNDNGFEAMAARWSKGATSSIHGHPPFIFYYVIKGRLKIDNYQRNDAGLTMDSTIYLGKNEHFFSFGKPDRFDNNIHQVQADEETLSLHISSDDATKGEVFSRIDDMAREYHNPRAVGAALPLCLPATPGRALELFSAQQQVFQRG